MGNKTTSSTLFKPELVQDLFSKVKGHSTLAKLCGASPLPFAGTETFIFTMDGEASIVAEGGQKPPGDAHFEPVIIQPYKFIYQHRVTDELYYFFLIFCILRVKILRFACQVTIVVKKYDRFSRNMREYFNITDELDKLGVSVYSLSKLFNTKTKEDKILKRIILKVTIN